MGPLHQAAEGAGLNSRYRRFSSYLRERFPYPVRKIPVDAGFTCPNRDGTKGVGGCTYCENRSFSPNSRGPALSVREQIEKGIHLYRKRGIEHFIVYFQAYTNTYAPVSHLREIYGSVREWPEVVGISIGTRPDCLPPSVLDLLEEHARDRAVWVEIGMESSHDRTLARLNRCHTFADFVSAVTRVRERALEVVAHTIFGLPGESKEEMLQTADRLAALPVQHVKLHHLYVSPGTVLEEEYRRGEVRLFEADEWVSLACDILERLRPDQVIQRLMGELDGPFVVAPLWKVGKGEILRRIEEELRRRDTRQGAKCRGRAAEG